MKVYQHLVIPENFQPIHESFKSHWAILHQVIESQPAKWRKENEELVNNISVKQHFLSLKFDDAIKEQELLREVPPVSESSSLPMQIDETLVHSNLTALAPEFFPNDLPSNSRQSMANMILPTISQSMNNPIAGSSISEPNQQQNPQNNELKDVPISQSQLGTHTLENVVSQSINPIAGQPQQDTINMDTNEQSPTIPSPVTEEMLARIMQTQSITTTPTTGIGSTSINTVSSATTSGTVTTSTASNIITTPAIYSRIADVHSSQSATSTNRYTIAQLDIVGEIFDKFARLPKIPNIATPEDFRALRDAIASIMNTARRAHLDRTLIEQLIITRTQEALNLYDMAFRFQFQISGLTYDDLREFLITNEEHLNNGVNICSRFARSQPVHRTTVQQTAVRNAAANLALPRSTAPRRSVSRGPNPKKQKNIRRPCYKCTDPEHKLFHCPQYLEWGYHDRYSFVIRIRICENCLDSNHHVSACTKKGCDQCSTKHNRTLCPLLVHHSH